MQRRQMIRAIGWIAGLGLVWAGAAQAAETASVADTALGGGRDGGNFFLLQAVNGQKVEDNALQASVRASRNRGPDLLIQQVERAVPAGKVRLSITARHAFAAPVQTLFRSESPPVEQEVEVELQAGRRYRVNGALDAYRHELWLEDVETGKPVDASLVSQVQDPEVAKAMAGALYTCCNLHYEGDWISDANWTDLPFVPAGARIVLKDYGRQRAQVLIDGWPMRIGLDYGRKQESREQFVGKLIVKDDPRQRLATYAPDVRDAIRAGKVKLGMTREQVIMSLGYPRSDLTASLTAEQWLYNTVDEQEFAVIFGPAETVVRVDAGPRVKSLVIAGTD
ncbi:hypothetical protein [Ideonella sp.]|uniref:hypothetical protein n=1 Tax=Ideonella sp. TaxID=1929293 RepID=UPI002B47719F|nr:hypothetical protein [Ideonella sp.]HJV67840.1 hypothetical protein [Ideonella sp.]